MCCFNHCRWHETLVNTKTNKFLHKHGEKNLAAGGGGKQASSGASKSSIHCGKSGRGGDSAAAGRRVSSGQQASNPVKPALRLRSSRSFSSLQSTSLTAAPFMRSSRSLSRLDQRSPDPDNTTAASSQRKKGRAAGRKILDSVRLTSSVEQISSSTKSQASSSAVFTASCHHHDSKETKQSKDGVYTLCAMTSGVRRNWVQAVLKNVRPGPPHELTSSFSERKEEQLEENGVTEQREEPQRDQILPQPPEGAQSSADVDSSSSPHPVSPSASPAPSPTAPWQPAEESEGAQLQIFVQNTKIGVTGASLRAEGFQRDSLSSAGILSVSEDCEEYPNAEQSSQHRDANKEEQRVSINPTKPAKDEEELPHEQQTVQLVKELQQTQRELSRIQQLNQNLQEELQQERKIHLGRLSFTQIGNSSSPEQALTLQQMQKINHNLHMELEALKRSQEEAREAELMRRVDLLAQQAQLLVTGDATALSQLHLEQDLQRFQEQKQEMERCTASLKSQLDVSEEKRKDAESQLLQLQQELQSQQNLQEEAEQLRKHLQEMSAQLCAYENAQAEKEARLQKHLVLLQASQERERRTLAASLAQAEQRSKDLQDKLGRAEQQLETFSKSQTLTREIEEAQRQLQEELACTVSAVQQLQEEREQLDQRCRELQNHLSEADREVSRLQDRLKTEETHYYNLEHSYERVCEDLQLSLGKVQQQESETQDIREGYERLLDRKEQELSEVLLKMEVLGNSLEETEVKLSELMKACTCSSSQPKGESSEPVEHKNKQQQTPEYFTVNESRMSSSQMSEVIQLNYRDPPEHARTRSHSADASFQYITSAGDNPEKFVSMIRLLETKLFVTEEKLRGLTHRLEGQQSHIGCQDPHLCSELTQSRANAQHLSLLLHSQAKQSQRFAQETENRCRMLVGRFQVALNIIQACRERLQATPVNIPDIERQLARAVGCLQQGEKDAGRVQHDSRHVFKEEGKILGDEKLAGAEGDFISDLTNSRPSHDMSGVEKYLIKELFVVEKMVSVLQNQNGICELSAAKNNTEDVALSYKSLISQRINFKAEERAASGRAGCDSGELLESVIGRFCAEAELIYAALKLQQRYESKAQVNGQEVEHQREALADISPSELASYEEQVKVDGRSSDEAAKLVKKEQSDDRKLVGEKEKGLLEKLVSRLQRRAKFLFHICQELTEGSVDHSGDNVTATDLNFFQEQVKLIYLSDRLYLDLEQEFQQAEESQNKLQALRKEREEQEMLNHALNQLQEDNSVLREELELAEHKIVSVETGNQRLLEDMQKIEDYQKEQMQKVETEFHEKIKELQQIHEEEMKQLHGYYSKSCVSKERQIKPCSEAPPLEEDSSASSDQAATGRKTEEGLWIQTLEVDAAAMREAYLKDLEKLQASCDQGFAAMEELHRKVIKDLQQQHQEQVAELLKEKDQLLQEETTATMAAIVAMRRSHKKELERSKQTQHIRESADVTELHIQYEKEIQLLHKELEMLSAQHTKKCLEISQLNQELQNERESVTQHQEENQELKMKQREADEMSQLPGSQSPVGPQVNDYYQMEMTLRAKEAEMQCLKQQALSLKEELEITRMDKAYAENKVKDLQQTNQHHESLRHLDQDSKFATWSPSRDASGRGVENSGATANYPPFPKKREKSSFLRQIRGIRSKSLKDGLSIQEKMKLFEPF
ncbi:myosin-9 isoform X1 [Kryptolebias marmoratus]|uniref:myosin-9 isoform X1 n=1 Tax=Kryptolebias marmoratus TaxID=37003 RepID=UPI0018ACA531|nr:myosin-9 isoform X1 [Kryptolebias marmoratus]